MKKIWKILRLVLAIIFFILAVHYASLARKNAGQVTIVLSSGLLSSDHAKEICEQEAGQEEPQSFCFWGEVPKASLTCKETGKSSTAAAVLVTGNSELVISGTGLLAYQTKGCFLDSDTSFALFGTEQAKGQIVWYDDCAYTVCGTFESLRRTMVCQAREEKGDILDMASLYSGRGGEDDTAVNFAPWGNSSGLIPSGRDEAEQFLLRYGLSGEIIDSVFLQTLSSNLLLILPLVIGFKSLFLLSEWRKNSRTRAGKIFLMASAAAVASITVILAIGHLQIPADMIPSRWSDFSFWSSWWQKQRENLLLIFGTSRGEAQLAMLWNLMLSLICNLSAVFLGSCI